MNQEAVFALRFVMKDFAKMQKGIADINKKMEGLKKTTNKASVENNKLSNSFSNAARSMLKFAVAYLSVQKIFSTATKRANEALQLSLIADMAGVARNKVEKLGKALKQYAGDARSAGSAYTSISDIIGGATHGKGLSEEVSRVNAMYGIGFNYGNISEDELMTEIAVAMNRLKNQGDMWGVRQIAGAYGIDDAMADFLATQGAGWKANMETFEATAQERDTAYQTLLAEQKIDDKMGQLVDELMPIVIASLEGIGEMLNVFPTFWGGKSFSERRDALIEKRNKAKQDEEIASKIKKSPYSVKVKDFEDYLANQKDTVESTRYITAMGEREHDLATAELWMKILKDRMNYAENMDDYTKASIFNNLIKEIEEENAKNTAFSHYNSPISFGERGGNIYVEVGGVTIENKKGTFGGGIEAYEKAIKSATEDAVLSNAMSNARHSMLGKHLPPSFTK